MVGKMAVAAIDRVKGSLFQMARRTEKDGAPSMF
jgi:hypothetical protein